MVSPGPSAPSSRSGSRCTTSSPGAVCVLHPATRRAPATTNREDRITTNECPGSALRSSEIRRRRLVREGEAQPHVVPLVVARRTDVGPEEAAVGGVHCEVVAQGDDQPVL